MYNVAVTVTCATHVEERRMAEALAAVIERHAQLRTRFHADDAGVLQRRAAPYQPLLDTRDLSDLAPNVVERRLAELAEELRRMPFALDDGEVVRARLVRLAAKRTALLLSIHHIVCDGASVRLLLEDLDAAYGGARLGPPDESFAVYAAASARADEPSTVDGSAAWRDARRRRHGAEPPHGQAAPGDPHVRGRGGAVPDRSRPRRATLHPGEVVPQHAVPGLGSRSPVVPDAPHRPARLRARVPRHRP